MDLSGVDRALPEALMDHFSQSLVGLNNEKLTLEAGPFQRLWLKEKRVDIPKEKLIEGTLLLSDYISNTDTSASRQQIHQKVPVSAPCRKWPSDREPGRAVFVHADSLPQSFPDAS